MAQETGMHGVNGEVVALKGVHIEASLSGLLLTATTQQRYVNKSRRNLEVVYTFPLPAHAVILGVDLTIGEKKLSGMVLEKSKAEEDYEDAIREGNMPVMVERSGPGLYTANLGNLKRGEEVVIDVRWSQLLVLRDGDIRLAIPTVIGKRYGDAHAQGALAPHQTDEVDLLAEYPLTFTLMVEGEVAQSRIHCASHAAQISSASGPDGEVQIVSIHSDAWLDRDIIVNVSEVKARQFGVNEVDTDGTTTALLSICPKLPAKTSPLALKILVDCSGSMEGDSIEQAREAVHQVMQELREGDFVSYSRFGTKVVHNFLSESEAADFDGRFAEEMLPADSKKIANLGRLIRATNANMGGTEMQSAIVSTIRDVVMPTGLSTDGFVQSLLLITDGDIWDHEGVVRAARNSGYRIFAIGVGSAPAESLLRELAETTGGACEFVSPNESMAKVALKMVSRMRSARTASIRIRWEEEPLWQSTLPKTIFENETLHIFATLKKPVAQIPAIDIEAAGDLFRSPTSNPCVDVRAGETDVACKHGPLARMAAAQRLLNEPQEKALETALEYGLITSKTNLLLVYVRESAEKTKELPELEQIKQMAAAGQAGYGTAQLHSIALMHSSAAARPVRFSGDILNAPSVDYARYDQPTVWRDPRVTAAAAHEAMTEAGVDRLNIPDFLRRQAESINSPDPSPAELMAMFNELARQHPSCERAIDELLSRLHIGMASKMISVLQDTTHDMYRSVILLLLWIDARWGSQGSSLERHAKRLIQSYGSQPGPKELEGIFALLDEELPKASARDWNTGSLILE